MQAVASVPARYVPKRKPHKIPIVPVNSHSPNAKIWISEHLRYAVSYHFISSSEQVAQVFAFGTGETPDLNQQEEPTVWPGWVPTNAAGFFMRPARGVLEILDLKQCSKRCAGWVLVCVSMVDDVVNLMFIAGTLNAAAGPSTPFATLWSLRMTGVV
jgi:hypothetical protein